MVAAQFVWQVATRRIPLRDERDRLRPAPAAFPSVLLLLAVGFVGSWVTA